MASTFILLTKLVPVFSRGLATYWSNSNKYLKSGNADILEILSVKGGNYAFVSRIKAKMEDLSALSIQRLSARFEDVSSRPNFNLDACIISIQNTVNAQDLSNSFLAERNFDPRTIFIELQITSKPFCIGLSSDEVLFSENCMENFSNLICSIASSFPSFHESFAQETLMRLEEISSKLDILVSDRYVGFELDFDSLYKEALVLSLSKLEIIGLNIALRMDFDISNSYVPIKAKPYGDNHTLRPANDRNSRLKNDNSIVIAEELVLSARRLYLLGDAGSGKTTFLKWLTVNVASRKILPSHTPIYIPLRKYAYESIPSINTVFSQLYPNLSTRMPKEWLNSSLLNGNVILLIDSVDEMPKIKRDAMRSWLSDLILTYPKIYIVITSRPSATSTTWLDELNFKTADLLAMDESEIYTFIDSWHYSLSAQKESQSDKRMVLELRDKMIGQVRGQNAILDMLSTPLLCASVCAINYSKRGYIPKDTHDLYDSLCRMLLDRRDTEQGIDIFSDINLSFQQKLGLISFIAYSATMREMLVIPEGEIKKLVSSFLTNINISDETTIVKVYDYLAERSGILRLYQHGAYEFIHRSIQEYLTAFRFVTTGQVETLHHLSENDQWQEVIIMAAAIAGQKLADDLIRYLIDKGDISKSNHKYYLLAARCNLVAPEVNVDVQNLLQTRIRRLLPPNNRKLSRLLASYGNSMISLLNYKDTYTENQCKYSVEALAAINTPESFQAILDYCQSKHAGMYSAILDALIAGEGNGIEVEGVNFGSVPSLLLENARSFDFTKYYSSVGFLSLDSGYEEFDFAKSILIDGKAISMKKMKNSEIDCKFGDSLTYVLISDSQQLKSIRFEGKKIDSVLLYTNRSLENLEISTHSPLRQLVVMGSPSLETIELSTPNIETLNKVILIRTGMSDLDVLNLINGSKHLRTLSIDRDLIESIDNQVAFKVVSLGVDCETPVRLSRKWDSVVTLGIYESIIFDEPNQRVKKLIIDYPYETITDAILSLPNLDTLIIQQADQIDNLAILADNPTISTLYLNDPSKNLDLSILSTMKSLKTLYINRHNSSLDLPDHIKIKDVKSARTTLLRSVPF